jgi:hypothetical protein
MKRSSLIVWLLLATLFVIGFSSFAIKGSFVSNSVETCTTQNCSDSWGECKPKVKVIGRNGSCITFACEVGTKNEHIIKTSDEEGKKALLKIAEPPESNTPGKPADEEIAKPAEPSKSGKATNPDKKTKSRKSNKPSRPTPDSTKP